MKLYWKEFHLNSESIGLIYGFLGVVGFSLTLPATRAAVLDLDPLFVGFGRGLVAAILAALTLRFTHQPIPSKQQFRSLLVVGLGVVLGFPVLSAWAMQQVPAAHGAVVLGLLPLATAIAGVLRAGDRPDFTFWIASIVGSTTVVVFGIISGAGHLQPADLALFGSVIAAAFAYAEGGRLAKVLGGWQVISWALVIVAPFEVLPTIFIVLKQGLIATPSAWLGFAYVSVVSQFVAFFAWYHGMAMGGVARVGQIQLLQPFLTILASAILLGETVQPIALGSACLVVACVAAGKKASIKRAEDL
ncbi:MAG: DMT family transporter [Microcoleus sp. PH2017_10_PVI_O_A]|uniref:DMT family transporter n=1 Tax=unclassified Microcoleus TaxID=2642155 RepID=UPI001DEDBDDB|nr:MULTISPECIES: DMT family transporter [unclassified Microcoleus]TAE77065.1 MAG: DMT family transporter [Oscillatoriales cyanobacterium]MCC3404570.1 DMT family transporter [Microcoleus sp. PH2017_10_PVI_O_A]MCC3463342.1 DMT family transporter [Microcoleus sp. PH2017_11_PCY_U_A]MCC3476888.1 DMT family transporter [Microcoleus sp. PH2017_12_PCY_D_A]MCC3527028.1 DMT family transporter [Microcoleus sp. PH2017_21_RUC_O_A]